MKTLFPASRRLPSHRRSPLRLLLAGLLLAAFAAVLSVRALEAPGIPAAPAVVPAGELVPVPAAKIAVPAGAKVDWQVPRPGEPEQLVARVVVQLISRSHYERKPFDTALSQRLYDAYFDRLDHEHIFFLASDIQDFGLHRDTLNTELQQGNLDFAYQVYSRFIQRVRERLEFVRASSVQPQDFTTNEEMLLDRAKEPWCADHAAQDEVWRLRVKNQLLTHVLMDAEQKRKEAARAEAEKKNGGAAGKPEKPGEKPRVANPVPPPKSPPERVVQFYERFLNVLQENESMDILEIYLTSYTQLFDPHSAYMAPASEDEFDIQMKLSLQGIGAVLTTEEGYVKILEVVTGGPADLDGRLQDGDRITAVAQEGKEAVDVINMPLNKVVRMIRGAKDTRVILTVLPADKGPSAIPVQVDIVRGEVKLTEQEAKDEIRTLPPVAGQAGPGTKVQVINLPSFYSDFEGRRVGNKDYKSASGDVRKLLEKGRLEGASGVILDLRSDGGGSLDEAVTLADLFLGRKSPVVQVRDAKRDIKIQSDRDAEEVVYGGPLIVMVNRFSASASEIVAAALQDYQRAVIVGDASTHGKGTVQTVYHLDTVLKNATTLQGRKPGSLKFTMAKFYRVNGGSTQQKGVTPDIIFPAFADFLEAGETHLPNCMPWDEIVPLNITPAADLQAVLPALRDESKARLAKDAAFQALVTSIGRYGEIRKAKSISLNQAKREALQLEEEAFSKQVRENNASSKRKKKSAAPEDDDTPARDQVLDETVSILGDLIRQTAATAIPVAETAAVAPKTSTPPETTK